MPADIFAVTAKETAKKLDANTRQGALSFSVANTQDRAVKTRATAKAEGASSATFKVEPETIWLNPHETKDFKVAITVPDATAPGTYGVKLFVVDEDAPDDFATVGPASAFEVPAKVVVNGGGFRWWWIAIPAGVIALGAGAWLLMRPKPPTGLMLHDACAEGDPAKACGASLKCVPLSAASLECRRDPKEKCANDSECSSYWCKDGACSDDEGKCTAPTDCRQPAFTCNAAQGHCLAANGQSCTDAALCDSHNCTAGTCQPPVVVSACPTRCPPAEYCNAETRRCLPFKLFTSQGYITLMKSSAIKRP